MIAFLIIVSLIPTALICAFLLDRRARKLGHTSHMRLPSPGQRRRLLREARSPLARALAWKGLGPSFSSDALRGERKLPPND